MLKRTLSLTKRDLILLWRNYFLAAILVLVVLYAVPIRFALPAEFHIKPAVVVWDTTPGEVFEQYMLSHAEASGTSDRLVVVGSLGGYEEALAIANRIGIKASGDRGLELIELSYQGGEHERVHNVLSAEMQALAARIGGAGDYPQFEVRELRPGTAPPRIPFNQSMVPFAVFSEAALVGIFLAAALLYSEKDERTLRAYRTSPGGVVEYILARSLAMGVLGLLFTGLLSLLTLGFVGNWLVIVPLVLSGAVVVTVLTLVVANLFNSLSQFIYPAMVMMFVLTLPLAPYFNPAISLPWIRILPTYPLLFAMREAYFMPENTTSLVAALIQMALTAAIVFPLAVLTFRRQLIARDV